MDDAIIYSERSKIKKGKGMSNKSKIKNILLISLSIAISAAIIASIIIIVLKILIPTSPPPPPPPSTTYILKRKIENEDGLLFKTELNQLNTIEVHQQYNETTIRNGKNISLSFDRKTIYNIYVISESEPIGELKYCYSKLYTCAISIAAECESNKNDNCVPETFLDLTKESNQTDSHNGNLQQDVDIENIIIPLCLFNITDNNAITSIKCPKSIDEGKIKGIILDLYFYRTPGIKRIEKEKNNITINIMDLEDGKKKVRETNGGPCGETNFNSKCTTDMNITKDKEGNLISYSEVATSNIRQNEMNNYNKIKVTHLNDITEKNNYNETVKLYKKNMEKLLEVINPYLQYYEQVSEDEFLEIYKLSIYGEKPKKKYIYKKKGRTLEKENGGIIKEENIFEYNGLEGGNIYLSMLIDSSLNSDTMKANSYSKFNEDEVNELNSNEHESILTNILNKIIILSKAGNHLANELYQNIKKLMGDITQEIQLKISNLNKLISYQNITEIFDSSYNLEDLEVLPISIVNESNDLYKNINRSLTNIKSLNSKQTFKIINDNINTFLPESHRLVDDISKKFKELVNSMKSKGNQYTQISLYYLNHKSSSYIDLIQRIEEILTNYYKDETTLIKSNISTIIENFENYLFESSEKEKNMISELSQKLDNNIFKIEDTDDNIIKKVIDDLQNSINILNDIKMQIEYLINQEMNLNDNYFLPQSQITIRNISYMNIINDAKKNQLIIDNLLIDPKFDEIMGYFRQNFTNDLISISKEIENEFNLEEEPLKENFKKSKITYEFNDFSKKAINEIKNEIDKYENKINIKISNFLKENKEELNSLIYDLYVFFSNESLIELAELYDEAYNSSLNTITNVIEYNEIKARQYFNDLEKFTSNNSYIISIINTTMSFENATDEIVEHLNTWSETHYNTIKYWNETITQRKITKGYVSKYNTYKANLEYSEDYINNQLYLDLINNYKNPIIKLRKALQTIKNNKLNDKYPNYPEIGFSEHKKIIDVLYNRLNTYLSDDLYNTKYIKPQNEYKSSKNKDIIIIKNYIENKNIIIRNDSISSSYDKDYCVSFQRIKSYLCTNENWQYKDFSDDYCYTVPNYSNNHNELKEISISLDEKLIYFNKKFNEFYYDINNIVEIYNSKLKKLNSDLKEIEDEMMNQKVILNYISEFQEEFNFILDNYFGDKLVKSSYDYYKNNTKIKIGKILNSATNKWENELDLLKTDLNNSINNFTSSIYELWSMAVIHYSVITQNISKSYYDSIIIHQKNEYNYTISYYYNYLLRLANSTHNYIINRILKNHNNFNYIEKKRINIINDFFKNLMHNITLSEQSALNLENQLNILGVEQENFFKANYIFEDNNQITDDYLSDKLNDIYQINNDIEVEQYSLIAKMYLENLESYKQINDLYKKIEDRNFIKLNEDKFKEIIINNNWVFNFYEFNNEIKVKLYNLKKEIEEDFTNHKEDYYQKIEKILNRFLTKEGIIEKVNEIYNEGVEIINEDKKNFIINNISEIINSIIGHLTNETIRIKNTANSFNNDTTLINNTINDYKQEILNRLNETIIFVANEFNQNMEHKFYYEYIDIALNEFYEQLKINDIGNKEYKFLNSTISFQEIINKILIDIQNEYKTITKKHLLYKYNQKLKEIYNIINLEEIKEMINKRIDSEFEKEDGLLSIIYQKGINDAGFEHYNFNDEIKNKINDTIIMKINNIEQIINSTKGNNYQIEISNWQKINDIEFSSFDNVKVIHEDIVGDFGQFCEFEQNYEKNSTNELLEEVVKNNFNNTLNYLIPTFGKLFFERIVKYNENYKIKRLYDDLRYSISETLAYYIWLSGDITDIPDDLKKKIYNLNNLDLTITNKNIEIMNKINGTINEFIKNIQKEIINNYNTSYINEFNFENYYDYDETLLYMIKGKLYNVETYIKNYCTNTLEKYLKESFIESYKKVINEKSNEMILFVQMQKEQIRVNIKEKETINTDNVLKIINENINKTEESINKYLSHLKTFKIDNEFIQFLYNYGKNNINPLFLKLIRTINDAKSHSKNSTLNSLNKKTKEYEDLFDLNEFIDLSNKICLYFNNNYIQNLTEYIKFYDPNNYKENLERQKMRYERRYLRYLEGNETSEDIENKYHEKIADKALDTTFNNILNSSEYVKSFIDSLNEFEDFDEKIKKYMKLINENYKKSKELIEEKKEKGIFDEELYNIYNERLINLHNMTKEYYYQINESYNNAKDYLSKSFNEIDDSLKHCKNVTYLEFNDEFNKIKNEITPYVFVANISNNDEISEEFDYKFSTAITGQFNYKVKVNSKKNAYFSLDLEFEDIQNYNPTIIAKIINLSGPKNMKINIIKGTSSCKENQKDIDVTFGSSNYSMIIMYNTQSTKINVTTITNFEEYSYSIKEYKFVNKQSEEPEYIIVNGIKIKKSNPINNCVKTHIENADDYKIMDKKNSSESILIDDFV